jgi:hypothetical protein
MTTIPKAPTSDPHGVKRTRELSEQQDAVRRLQMKEDAVNINGGTNARQGTVRLNELVDRATQTTQTADRGEAGRTSTIGAAGAAPLGRTNAVDELAGHEQVFGTAETRLSPATAPRINFDQRTVSGAESFARNLDHAVNNIVLSARAAQANVDDRGVRALSTVGVATGRPEMAGMGADELLSTFLKLNINDPNENVETHDKLYSVYTQLRQQGIEDAKKQSENAQAMKKEAEAYAKQAEMLGTVVTVLSIALTIVTFGAAAPAAAAAVAGTQAATVAATTAAQQAIAQAGKEAVATAVKAAVKEVVSKAAQEATKEGMKQAIQTAAKEAAQKIVSQLGQQVSQQVVDQMANQLVGQVTQELTTQLAQQGASTAVQTMASTAGQELAANIAAQSATTGVQGTLNTGRQFMQEMGTRTATTMNRTLMMGSAAAQGVAAGANYKAADKAADARQAQLGVDRSRFRADQAQERIQDEGEVINTIMEHKNQTIDAVMQMTNATWASRQQLMAASVAR